MAAEFHASATLTEMLLRRTRPYLPPTVTSAGHSELVNLAAAAAGLPSIAASSLPATNSCAATSASVTAVVKPTVRRATTASGGTSLCQSNQFAQGAACMLPPSSSGFGTEVVALQSHFDQKMEPQASPPAVVDVGESSAGNSNICAICFDHPTGRHYGVISCDGCKGFFRRTIRQNLVYECRFQQNCSVERGRRNACRFCRYNKCLNSGMRKEAVQSERDKLIRKRSIGGTPIKNAPAAKRRAAKTSESSNSSQTNQSLGTTSPSVHQPNTASASIKLEPAEEQGRSSGDMDTAPGITCPLSYISHCDKTNYKLLVKCLLGSEDMFARVRKRLRKVFGQEDTRPDFDQPCIGNFKLASMEMVESSMTQQLLALTELLKLVPVFRGLPLDDQVSLLRACAAEYLLLTLANRSLPYDDILLLSDEVHILQREFMAEMADMNHIVCRVLDELVEPMKQLRMDTVEYACIKAIAFFNPDVCSKASRAVIEAKRQILLVTLENYIADKPQKQEARLGNIFLLLPRLQGIAQELRECVQLTSLLGFPKIDAFIQELIGNRQASGTSNASTISTDCNAGCPLEDQLNVGGGVVSPAEVSCSALSPSQQTVGGGALSTNPFAQSGNDAGVGGRRNNTPPNDCNQPPAIQQTPPPNVNIGAAAMDPSYSNFSELYSFLVLT